MPSASGGPSARQPTPSGSLEPPPVDHAPGRGRAATFARNWGPWLVVIASLAWVGHVVKWHELYVIARQAPIERIVFWSSLFLIANCAADTFATLYTFRWFGCRVPFRELYVMRAATYLLAIVQYYVGQAALVAWLHQRKRVPVVQGSGWILFISGINLGVLLLFAAAGLLTVRRDVPWTWIEPAAVGVGVVVLLYAALIQLAPRALVNLPLLGPLFEMGVVGHVKATVVRVPHVMLLVVWHYYMMNAFGVHPPPLVAFALLPVMFFATALPISVQGVGPTQAVAVLFFTQYAGPAGKAGVLAYSLGTTSISFLLQGVMGLAFLAPARKLGMPEHPVAEVREDAAEDARDEQRRRVPLAEPVMETVGKAKPL